MFSDIQINFCIEILPTFHNSGEWEDENPTMSTLLRSYGGESFMAGPLDLKVFHCAFTSTVSGLPGEWGGGRSGPPQNSRDQKINRENNTSTY